MKKGKFIVIEGLDGAGSSTQVELLVKKLNQAGKKSHSTKEPTNNIVGGLIRGLLTHEWSTTSEGFQLLFAADRAHHLKQKIMPVLEHGENIVSDRYYFSTIAFGSVNLNLDWLKNLNKYFLKPDLIFFIKVRPDVCLERIGKSRHRREFFEEKTKLEKTFKTYLKLAQDKKYNTIIIDGEQEIEKVSQDIFEQAKKLLKSELTHLNKKG